MKKHFAGWLALVLALAVSLAACGTPPQRQPVNVVPPSAAEPAPSIPEPGSGCTPPESSAAPESESIPSEGESVPPAESSSVPGPASESQPAENELPASQTESENTEPENTLKVTEDGWYDTKDEVALYIHLYNRLPGNYVTKNQAQKKGWQGGSVEKYTGEGTAIGGSRFGNYEGLLPEKKGRSYTECDINTVGKKARGAERIIFSNDGLVYYTGDHYESFELLYGEP